MLSPKIILDCDHIIDGIKYLKHNCIRCKGRGWYKDFQLLGGAMTMVSGVDRLKQDVLHHLSLERGKVFYDEDLGILLDSDLNEIKIRAILTRLKNFQEQAGLPIGEKIYSIVSITEEREGVTDKRFVITIDTGLSRETIIFT